MEYYVFTRFFLFTNIVFQLFWIYKYNWKFVSALVLDEKQMWNPKYDRLLLLSSTVLFICSFYFSYGIINNHNSIYEDIIFLTAVLMFSLLIYLIHTDKITEKFKSAPKKTNLDGNIDMVVIPEIEIAKEKKKKLYDNLRKFDVIDDDLKEEEFYSLFLKEPIKLNLTCPEFHFFANEFNDCFKSNINMIVFHKFFINSKTNKIYNYNSVRSDINSIKWHQTEKIKNIFDF